MCIIPDFLDHVSIQGIDSQDLILAMRVAGRLSIGMAGIAHADAEHVVEVQLLLFGTLTLGEPMLYLHFLGLLDDTIFGFHVVFNSDFLGNAPHAIGTEIPLVF